MYPDCLEEIINFLEEKYGEEAARHAKEKILEICKSSCTNLCEPDVLFFKLATEHFSIEDAIKCWGIFDKVVLAFDMW